MPPAFDAVEFDAQVDELVASIVPTDRTDQLVQRIVQNVSDTVCKLFPTAEVYGMASGSATGGTAFGVAVPEVEVVASINPDLLAERLQLVSPADAAKLEPTALRAEARRLQKAATRLCTYRLVASGSFKFRRSSFRAQEPKVTLLAVSVADSASVPFDLSVNAAMPLCNAALMTECGRIEPRVGMPSEGPLLPALKGFAGASGLLQQTPGKGAQRPSGNWSPQASSGPKLSIGELFRAFVAFCIDMDWRGEAVAVHLGRRGPPELAAELHLVFREDESVEVAPSIQDPFEPRQNVASCTSAAGLARMHEEFCRAHALCKLGATLSKVLEPWCPEVPEPRVPHQVTADADADAGGSASGNP